MKLVEHKLEEFMQLLSSEAPAPGGGSAAALMGSVGASLASMVASLTIGKEKYLEFEPLAQELHTAGERMRLRFLALVDLDTEAFNEVSAAYKLPKQTETEKEQRRNSIEKALQKATEVPFSIMETAADGLKVIAGAVGKTNASAASDLGVAAYSLQAAAHGAWLNVLINIGGIKDAKFVAYYKETGEILLKDSDILAETITRQIVESL